LERIQAEVGAPETVVRWNDPARGVARREASVGHV